MPFPQFLSSQRRATPVLVKWRRELRAFFCFPVTFRTALEGVPFMITSVLVLFYAIAPGNHEVTDNLYGAVLNLVKYIFAMSVVTWFAVLATVRQRINLSPLFPLAALALSVAGGASFLYSIAVEPGRTTYASALIPLFVPALPLVVPTRATHADGADAIKYLLRIIGIAAIFHVLWFSVDYASGLGAGDPGSYSGVGFAYAPACFVVLCGFSRRNILLVLAIGLVGLSLVLRVSSTTAFIAIFAIAVIVLHWLGYRRLVRVACVLFSGAIIVGNLAVFMSEEVAQEFYSIEPLVKEYTLEAESNNGFRLGVISAVRDEMANQSMFVGKFFAGDIVVNPRKYLPWWEGPAPIHSDYILMFQQGGLIGYGLFASLLMGLALSCARAARIAHTAGNAASETLFDAVQSISVIYMLCITGNPTLNIIQYTLWYLMLMPLTIFLARAQPAFARRSRWRATRCQIRGISRSAPPGHKFRPGEATQWIQTGQSQCCPERR